MRQPMEEVYGAELFAKTWEDWVDGIAKFENRPEGTELMWEGNKKIKRLRRRRGAYINDVGEVLVIFKIGMLSSDQGASAWSFCP